MNVRVVRLMGDEDSKRESRLIRNRMLNRAYYRRHRERLLQKAKEKRARPEYHAAQLLRHRAWRLANRTRANAYERLYYWTHPQVRDRKRIYMREWRKAA